MSKTAFFTFLTIVLLAVVTVINFREVNAGEGTKFVKVPVVSQDQADYTAEAQPVVFRRVDPAIMFNAAVDRGEPSGSVPTIPYTIQPPKAARPSGRNNNQSVDQNEAQQEHGNSTFGQSQGNSGNNHGQDNKDKVKDNGKDGNQDSGKGVDKEVGRDKKDSTSVKETKVPKTK